MGDPPEGAEGWSCDPKTGVVTRPDGRVHIKTSTPNNRYVRIELWGRKDGKLVKKFVQYSRFVCWLAHGAPPHPSFVADHIDRDILNNHPSNLRWVTRSENAQNTSDEVKAWRKQHMTEISHEQMLDPKGPHTLSFKKADEIRYRYFTEDPTQTELAQEYGVSRKTISDVVFFRRWVPWAEDMEADLVGQTCRDPEPVQ